MGYGCLRVSGLQLFARDVTGYDSNSYVTVTVCSREGGERERERGTKKARERERESVGGERHGGLWFCERLSSSVVFRTHW